MAAWGGVLAAILFAAGYVLLGVDAPVSDTSRAEVVADYTDDGTNARQALGMLLAALGAVCFLPFLSRLRALLEDRTAPNSVLPGVAFAGGLLLVGGYVAGAIAGGSVSGSDFFDAYRVDADLVYTSVVAGFLLNGFAGIAGGVLIASLAIVAYRTGLLPKWLAVVGMVIAVVSIPAAMFGMWILVESAWIALAAGLLAHRGAEVRTSAGRSAAGPDAVAST
jgi:hypothetical protein